ncbi:MAG TPA: hypothetical protein VF155_13045 [Candidatus Dormibacteraeota bacterium]
MARSYAQLAAVVFAIVGVGGFITGDASHVVHGQAGGNFDGVALHFTVARNIIDLTLAGAFGYAGFYAVGDTATRIVLAAGAFLLLLAAVGFIVGDTPAGERSIASLHFPLAMNVLDVVAGGLAVICALGTQESEAVRP